MTMSDKSVANYFRCKNGKEPPPASPSGNNGSFRKPSPARSNCERL